MRFPSKKIFWLLLPMAIILIASHVLAQEKSTGDQTYDAKEEATLAVPDLAEIIPLAAELTSRLVTLENKVADGLDVSSVEGEYAKIEASLKEPANQLQQLKDSKEYNYNKLVDLREKIEQENTMFREIGKPVSRAIGQLGAWREEWLAEQKRWNELQSFLLKEEELVQLKSTFVKADDTIERALNLILPQLDVLLSIQQKGGTIQPKINVLAAEVDSLILLGRRNVLLEASPPMFSPRYFSQFSNELWYAVQKGLDEISWPDSRFFDRLGLVILLQAFLSLFLIVAIYRNRQVLYDSERWNFLAARPFSAGLFLVFIVTVFIYEYQGTPAVYKLTNMLILGISFIRLYGGLITVSWKRQFVYGVVIIFIVTSLMVVLNFPLPLFRLYIVLTGLVGLLLCVRWAGETTRLKESGFYNWLLRLVSLFFAVIIIGQILGKHALSLYLLESLIDSVATVLVFMLYTYMIFGGLEWLFHSSPLRRVTVLHSDISAIIRGVAFFINVPIWGLVVLPYILRIWGVFDSLGEAINGLLALGFNLGAQRISVGLLLASSGILYGSVIISRILQKVLMDEVLVKSRVERGVRVSIGRLVHYVLIFTGFVLALLILGFKFTELTILLSALGVGIGFGLQSIVNNFVSGLILLFERPVRVGDIIELGGKWTEIKRIGLRATTVQTFDQADVIIPNADLVSNQVTNWTLSNRQVRLIIPVGVAYGSDVPLVMETLKVCAKANSKVAQLRAPQVLFLGFGESSLDFELRVWILDADDRLEVKSELHQDIDRSFREAGIVIAFPQQDVHLNGTKPVEIRVLSEDLNTDKK